jgi:poly-gamma-glutamate synthesis protein (capsule biosynthesis protein)
VSAAGDLNLGSRTTPATLEPLAALLAGELRVVNLEGPLTTRGTEQGLGPDGRPQARRIRFAADPALARGLAGRVDVAVLENNHALDAGAKGRADTVRALEGAGVAAALEASPAVVERGGLRVTVLARDLPREPSAQDIRTLTAAVKRAREGGPVLVSLHWGKSGSHLPTRAQQQLARALVDAGASAVLGHGPHTLQGVELHGRGVIAYSLGNLAFSCRCTEVRDAYVLRFQLAADGGVSEVRALPVRAGLAGEPPARADDADVAQLLVSVSEALETDAHIQDNGEVALW